MRITFALFTLAASVAFATSESADSQAQACYEDHRGGAAGLLAGTVLDNSNGGSVVGEDLVGLDAPLIEGPLLGKRGCDGGESKGKDGQGATYKDSRGGPGGTLAGHVIDNSNGGSVVGGDLVGLDEPLIKGPIIKRVVKPKARIQ